MKVLFIMRYWPVYGGGETVSATLANEFINLGIDVHCAYKYFNSVEPMPYQLNPCIKTVNIHTIEKYEKKDITTLHNYIKKNDIDVMINQWGNITLCSEAVKGTKCKLIHCCHTSVIMKVDQPNGWKQKLLYNLTSRDLYEKIMIRNQIRNLKKNYELCDKYIFLSKSFAEEFLSLTKIIDRKNKVGFISNPLTFDNFFDCNKDFDRKRKNVLFVGRIFEYPKRLSLILKIWKKIESDSSCNDWALTIVGDGDDLEKTKELSNNLELKRISFEGFKAPKPFYEQASIFLMTSSCEGFGMTLVEAQQHAVVPIAMDSYSSLHDIIENGKNGIIVKDGDIAEFCKSLKNIMFDDMLRYSIARQGVEDCKRFSIKKIKDQWMKTFWDLTNE